MVTTLGTRTRPSRQKMYPDQGSRTLSRNTDKGMTKRVSASLTFTASDGKATGASATFTGNFAVGDPLQISGTNRNNGFRAIIATDGDTYLILDPPPKDEGPVTCVMRTP